MDGLRFSMRQQPVRFENENDFFSAFVNVKSVSALNMSYLLGDEKVIELLVQNGADVNQKDNNGTANLHSAAYLGDGKTVEILVHNFADVNIENKNGETALHIATFIGRLFDSRK